MCQSKESANQKDLNDIGNSQVNKSVEPLRYISIGLEGDQYRPLVSLRVVPVGREGNKIIARTLNYGEEDSGEGIVRKGDEGVTFPPGNMKITIQDFERDVFKYPDGYAQLSGTIWSWLICFQNRKLETTELDLAFFRFIVAASRRIDMAHYLCYKALKEVEKENNEPYFRKEIDRTLNTLGIAEQMCIALNRGIKMIRDIPGKFSMNIEIPAEINKIFHNVKKIRDSFEHIEERAFGNVKDKRDSEIATTIFQQDDFDFGVLRYGNHSLDLRSDVIPALLSCREFIFNVAKEKTKEGKNKRTMDISEDGKV